MLVQPACERKDMRRRSADRFRRHRGMTLRNALIQNQYDCVLVGAGVRTVPTHFLLFEKIINTIHAHAPGAKICFNTKPSDTAEAVNRWI